MDPPRSKTKKGRKKGGRRRRSRSPRRDDHYVPHHDEVHLDSRGYPIPQPAYDSDVSSFDEVNLSDAGECPTIAEKAEESEDDEAVVKRLYKGPRKCRCCVNWVKKPLQPATDQKAKEKTTKHAITARYASVKRDTQVITSVHSVAVHSQPLKDLLSKLLDSYPGVNIGRKDASFYPPFQPLVHVWKELETCVAELEGEAREHADAFIEIIEPEISETIKDRDDLLSRGLVTYELLWTLYKPGDRVFCEVGNTRHLMQVTGTLDELNSFGVNLTYWDLATKKPTKKDWSEFAFPFQGTKAVTELGAIPYDLFPNADAVRKELQGRGRKVRAIQQGSLKLFKGFVTVHVRGEFGTGSRKKWIEGRIIVDDEEWGKNNSEPYSFSTQPVPLPDPFAPLGLGETTAKEDEVSEDMLAQSRSIVRGFSLATKSWHEFEVDDVSDIQWNDQAFDQLVMQPSRKRLIKALVDSNQGRESGFDDFIRGKGQGLVVLLNGPPGTGKTLTAESIAERIHLPLYSVHSSELSTLPGATGTDIEAKLAEILHRAAHWNAVLLIDEADAFLETRSAWDMERNQRVAVFLRLLEFYSGVLILTTNRRIAFDPAFYSRIHLTLRFEDLDHGARASVWKNFLRSMRNNVHEGEVERLAQRVLNGRQIKNVVKMASLLAHSEGATLCMEHLETMLEAVDEIGRGDEESDCSRSRSRSRSRVRSERVVEYR